MKSTHYIYLINLFLLTACYPDIDYVISGYAEKIIVEGKIEAGKAPQVYLSLNVPLSEKVDESRIRNKIISDAKVTISNGTHTEILTSKRDTSYFPPYVYFGTEIRGEVGKTYNLTVEKGGYVVNSQTTIPDNFQINSIYFKPSEIDSLRSMIVSIAIDKTKKNAYRIFTKKMKDNRYIETPVIFNSELNLEGLQNFAVSPIPHKKDPSYAESKYFLVGEIVDVKVMAIDSAATQFFKDMGMFTLLADNISINEIKPLSSNVTEPGFGIWYGANVQFKRLMVQ